VEEDRGTAFGLRRRRCRTHLACVVGEVASHAIDPAHREHAATANWNPRDRERVDDVPHRDQRRMGWPGLDTTLYSASSTSARGLPGRAPRRPRSRPNDSIAAPTNRPTTSSTASTATPTSPSATRSSGLRGLRGVHSPRTPEASKRAWSERKETDDIGSGCDNVEAAVSGARATKL